MNRQSSMGKKIAGTKFMTLILVIPSMFKLMARMSSDPAQDISAMTASLSSGARAPAASVMTA